MAKQFQNFEEKCLRTLSSNHISTAEGRMFVAGAHQFRTLWTRDFCYSVPGILKVGFHETVERQLRVLFLSKNKQNLLPRGLDVVNPKTRVLWNTALRFLPHTRLDDYQRKLIAEYLGEHRTPAFDSNLLFLRCVIQLARYRKQAPIFSREELTPILEYYESYIVDQLLHQPPYSDWQDSAKRTGSLLLTQLLYLDVLLNAHELNIPIESFKIHGLQRKIMDRFFDGTLFNEQIGQNQKSLDSHCFILCNPNLLPKIDNNYLYKSLKQNPLWTQAKIPGIPVWPEHHEENISWTTKLVGLRHYHDKLHWGWLAAEAAKTSKLMGDREEFERIVREFERDTAKDQHIAEIYSLTKNELTPFKSLLYLSESPFTWSAAKWLEAIHA